MIRPWFRQAAVPWKTTATQTRASGENRVSTKPGVFQGGEHGELHGAPQGGLADEQAGERGVGIEVVVGEHPYRLELFIAQQMGLVDDQDGGLAALVALGGENGG